MVKKLRTDSDSPLEALRLDFTTLTQDEFVFKCGLSRATYQRWIRGETIPKLSPEQIVQICRVCQITFEIFFTRLGVDTSGIPKKMHAQR
jgi:transcriptional regulator with XRE-family HTH domain